jgi:hypothetical protein
MPLAGQAAKGQQQELARDWQRRAVEGDGDEDDDVSVGEDQADQRVEEVHVPSEEQDEYHGSGPLKSRDFEGPGQSGGATGKKLIAPVG